MMELVLLLIVFIVADAWPPGGSTRPTRGRGNGSLPSRCYACQGTTISAVTSSCWRQVDETHTRFVAVVDCPGSCSTTVQNLSTIGLVQYTRNCDVTCEERCRNNGDSSLCKYCCFGDRCNERLPASRDQDAYDDAEGASLANVRKWLLTGAFSKPRHHAANPSNKVATRNFIRMQLLDFDLPSHLQQFRVSQLSDADINPLLFQSFINILIKGHNVVATVRGRDYGTSRDRMIAVIAHYDTHSSGTPGVDDNGSGVVALLEIARLLMRKPECRRNRTVVLVAVDFKEEGRYGDAPPPRDGAREPCFARQFSGMAGTAHFVCGWLLPHLQRTRSELMLAINLHSLLNYDARPGSQSMPSFQAASRNVGAEALRSFRQFRSQVAERKFAGDWILASYLEATTEDGSTSTYAETLQRAMRTNSDTPLIRQQIPFDGDHLRMVERDDCLPFAYLPRPLPCISLTDTGKLRGYMRRCHNVPCDDITHVTSENLKFMAKVIDGVWMAIEELSGSSCSPASSSVRENATASDSGGASGAPPSRESTTESTSQQLTPSNCDSPLLQRTGHPGQQNSASMSAVCGMAGGAVQMCNNSDPMWVAVDSEGFWSPPHVGKLGRSFWLEVDLGRATVITAALVKGVRGIGHVTRFRLSHSVNGERWRRHWRADGSAGLRGGRKVALTPAVRARFIRIHPRKWKRRIALRIGLDGCDAAMTS